MALSSSQWRTLLVTVPVPGMPVKVQTADQWTAEVEVFPLDSNVGANMYIGNSTTDMRASAGNANSHVPRPKGVPVSFTSGQSANKADGLITFNLNTIYVDADGPGDKMVIQYRRIA